MSSRRKFSRLRPVQSVKHIVETNGTVLAAASSTTSVVQEDANIDYKTTVNRVKTGSTVHAIFLNVQTVAVIAAGGINNIYMAVIKNPGSQLVIPSLDTLGSSVIRKFVIHQEMIMTGQAGGNPGAANIPRTLFKGVIMIPPRLKRFGVDDQLQVVLQHRTGEATQTTQFCLESIYKEFQ